MILELRAIDTYYGLGHIEREPMQDVPQAVERIDRFYLQDHAATPPR